MIFGRKCSCAPFATPFGGPASGLTPSKTLPQQALAAPAAAAAPTPTPTPTCTTPSIFADCFGACTGQIDGASPGPVCGWTFIEPFGALGGEVNFTPGQASIDTFDADDFPIMAKSLSAPLASVFGISGQFDFTEYQTAPNLATAYQFFLNNQGLTETFTVSLIGDGNIFVQAGAPASAPSYSGAWTPNGGAHVVHFSLSALGVPTLWIDGVEVPLTSLGDIPSFAASFPANSVSYGGGSGDAAAAQSPLRSLFFTEGILGPTTEFCCPA